MRSDGDPRPICHVTGTYAIPPAVDCASESMHERSAAARRQQTSNSGCGNAHLRAAYRRFSPGRIGASSRRARPR